HYLDWKDATVAGNRGLSARLHLEDRDPEWSIWKDEQGHIRIATGVPSEASAGHRLEELSFHAIHHLYKGWCRQDSPLRSAGYSKLAALDREWWTKLEKDRDTFRQTLAEWMRTYVAKGSSTGVDGLTENGRAPRRERLSEVAGEPLAEWGSYRYSIQNGRL